MQQQHHSQSQPASQPSHVQQSISPTNTNSNEPTTHTLHKNDSAISLLIEEQKNSSKRMTALSKHVPGEIVQQAVDRLTNFRQFRSEAYADVKQIMAIAQRMKQKMTSKLHADNKWTGLLTGKRTEYFDCLQVDEKALEKLFEQDHKFWLKNLQRVKDEVAERARQLEVLLENQGSELQQLLDIPTTPEGGTSAKGIAISTPM